VFHTATIALEGHVKDARFGAMWECVPVLEILSNKLIRLQDEYPLSTTFKTTDLTGSSASDHVLPGANPATEFMCESVNTAWIKFQEYYKLIDRSVWYTAGLVLNPE
jgi:hypothetical protein